MRKRANVQVISKTLEELLEMEDSIVQETLERSLLDTSTSCSSRVFFICHFPHIHVSGTICHG